MDFLTINIPYNLKIVLWKNKKNKSNIVHIFNSNKIFKLYLVNENIFIDKWSNSLCIIKNFYKLSIKLNNRINIFLKSWDTYFFDKIKFKGKGFRIRSFKKIKLIKFFFGKSHKTFILIKKIKKKRINKYKFLIYCINKKKLKNFNVFINKIKPMNMYTLRGLRSSKQIIYKRKGKKGTYI